MPVESVHVPAIEAQAAWPGWFGMPLTTWKKVCVQVSDVMGFETAGVTL